MSIDRLRAHYGFTRMPFGKNLAPGMLHAHRAHGEAVARIGWCVSEQMIGVITGECGAGKTVADGLAYVAAWNAAFLASEDLGEAVAAFAQKRPPKFSGK